MAAKCKVCVKSVYPMDPQINLDGSVFHKPCAKCADCQCQITIANFTKNESGDTTLLLCKTHYFKRFHEEGGYVGGDKFQNRSRGDAEKAIPLATNKSSNKCKICSKSVYPMDRQINLDGSIFHQECAKCADCQCQITLENFNKNETGDATLLLCKTHYFKRFHEGGSYLGGEKFQVKNSRDVNAASVAAAAADPVKSASADPSDKSFDFASLKKGGLSPKKSDEDEVTEKVAEVSVAEPTANGETVHEEQPPAQEDIEESAPAPEEPAAAPAEEEEAPVVEQGDEIPTTSDEVAPEQEEA